MDNDVFNGLGVEIDLKHAEDFLKVKETLTRIGIAAEGSKRLYQSCHILHKRGRYSIMHFKELFALDGKEKTFTDEDIARRDYIVGLLRDWNLVDIVHEDVIQSALPTTRVNVLSFRDKADWQLIAKYSIGSR